MKAQPSEMPLPSTGVVRGEGDYATLTPGLDLLETGLKLMDLGLSTYPVGRDKALVYARQFDAAGEGRSGPRTLHRNSSCRVARRGFLPSAQIRERRWVVPTARLLELLGLTPEAHAESDVVAGGGS